MEWVLISERLPPPFKLVALMDSRAFMNVSFTEDQVPVCRVGYFDNSLGGYWSCYGERAQNITAFTHWAKLPGYKNLECFKF